MSVVTNPAYRAAVKELEAILKADMYRQLQVSMPVTEAKSTISNILVKLKGLEGAEPEATDHGQDTNLEAQEEHLNRLKESLKPYNLYFEWPEVQKLRAQVQLLEEEHAARKQAAPLVRETESQLEVVARKLEDQLVLQAKDISELEEALDLVASLGGAEVRRLENLIGQIREAQQQRQLAPAEIERSRKLSHDLRKLMESSIYAKTQGGDDTAVQSEGLLDVASSEEGLLTIDSSNLDPEVSARLLLLDLEGEGHDLQRLEKEYVYLLAFRQELATAFAQLRSELELGNSVEDDLTELTAVLASESEALRQELVEELAEIGNGLSNLPDSVDAAELQQAILVSQGILSTTLPSKGDMQHVRDLNQQLHQRAEHQSRQVSQVESQHHAQVIEQAALLDRLETTLTRYRDTRGDAEEFAHLSEHLVTLRTVTDDNQADPELVAEVRRAEEQLEASIVDGSDDARLRERAKVAVLLAQVEQLPGWDDTFSPRIDMAKQELTRLLEEVESTDLGSAQLETTEAVVNDLKTDYKVAGQKRLEHLATTIGDLESPHLLGRLREASEALDAGGIPNIANLEQAVVQERAEQRAEQLDDVAALEREAVPYALVDPAAGRQLATLLTEARGQLGQGKLTSNLKPAWALIESMKALVERRLADFVPRLDAALEAFEAVLMLNSEDVGKARRILNHLDSQRGSIAKVSVSLKIQLETSLQEAEGLIAKLQEEVAATRVIADQLVSENVLDDVLSLFGDDDDETSPAEPAAVSADPVGDWLGGLVEERGVQAVVVIAGESQRFAGALEIDGDQLSQCLRAMGERFDTLGNELSLGDAHTITLEMPSKVVIATWPAPEARVLLLLDDPSVLNLTLHRLRSDEDQLRTMFRAS